MKTLETNTTRDRCIICGKKLTGRQRKYCSRKCGQRGYKTGKAESKINAPQEVKVLYERFLKSFKRSGGKTYRGVGQGFYIRIFVSACEQIGYSDSSISEATKLERSNICRHRLNVKKEEAEIARQFLENKDYVYGSKYNDFNYGEKK